MTDKQLKNIIISATALAISIVGGIATACFLEGSYSPKDLSQSNRVVALIMAGAYAIVCRAYININDLFK